MIATLEQAKMPQFIKLSILNALQMRPSWSVYCGNSQSSQPLALQTIQNFEYFDADYRGRTTSEGFKKLMNIWEDTIQLRFFPSWQLYKVKQYSPQLRGAYEQKEYFYFYDLKNKYLRMPEYMPNNINYAFIDSTMLDSSGIGPNGTGFGDIIFSNYNSPFFGSRLSEYQPEGLRLTYRNKLRGLVYQQDVISKSVSEPNPVRRSSYYDYSARWEVNEYSSYITQYSGIGPDTCFSYPSYANVFDSVGCYSEKYFPGKDFSFIPVGTIAYLTADGLAYVCPINSLDTNGLNVIVLYSNPYPYDVDTVPNSNLRMQPYQVINNVLWLKEVVVQIDTIPSKRYLQVFQNDSLPFPSDGLVEFLYTPDSTLYGYYAPIYPFDTLSAGKVLKRNVNGLITLLEDEKHLKTRIYYNDTVQYVWHLNKDCFYENFSSKIRRNIGLPSAMTVGYGLPDSLHTTYTYFPDGSIEKITLPNGQYSNYVYDQFGRLNKSFANGNLISQVTYHQWRNNHSLNFEQRTLQNFIQTYTYLNDTAHALYEKAYIDPLGRAYHSLSYGVTHQNLQYPLSVLHSGRVVYDNLDRPVKQYYNFVETQTSGIPQPLIQSTNPVLYPNASIRMAYEDNPFGRMLRQAEAGEVLTVNNSHNKKYRYGLSNYVCAGCEMQLSAQESDLVFGSNPDGGFLNDKDVVLRWEETEDEDGKTIKVFYNALGQKVAVLQYADALSPALTIFAYDSYGNIKTVINPKKQATHYRFNMLGKLYEEEHPDKGITRYMYDRSGNVVLMQDENAREGMKCNDNRIPYYRFYQYDKFNRLIAQSKVLPQSGGDAVMDTFNLFLYHTDTFNFDFNLNQRLNPSEGAYVYTFTNNSTYFWKAKVQWYDNPGNNYPPNYGFYEVPVTSFAALYQPFFEKKWFYHFAAGTNASVYNLLDNNSQSMSSSLQRYLKGNLSYTLTYAQYDSCLMPDINTIELYSYNKKGQLWWQTQQFNPNGITPTDKGVTHRIDYNTYTLSGKPLVETVDINNDYFLDIQYHYGYDYRGNLKWMGISRNNGIVTDTLVHYTYNYATGNVIRMQYAKLCADTVSIPVDDINYQYDLRRRLTAISGNYYSQNLYYDNNQPTQVLAQHNFNGNINATVSAYHFGAMSNYATGQNFDQPEYYGYKYDGLNRLTEADCYWSENIANPPLPPQALTGDAIFTYDIVGNIKTLNRRLPNGNWQRMQYHYPNNNNRLQKIVGLNPTTADRQYTYDGNGNLLTDDFRKINLSLYGHSNLPYKQQLHTDSTVLYYYDINNRRIYKNLSYQPGKTGIVLNAEYYLYDVAGNVLGIHHTTQNKWTWYAYGLNRVARINPDSTQQPLNARMLPAAAPKDTAISNNLNPLTGQLQTATKTTLYQIQQTNGKTLWLSAQNYTTYTDTVPDSTYTVTMVTAQINQATLAQNAQKTYIAYVNPDSTQTNLKDTLTARYPVGGIRYKYFGNTMFDSIAYYNTDHLGNTRVVYTPKVNCGEPKIQALWLNYAAGYYPYGKTLREWNAGEERYLSTQNELDSESGLYYRNARYQDADIARFLGVDALKEKYPSMSSYSYVGGNPVHFIDPGGNSFSPIYNTDGELLGTDDEGLQGDPLVLNESDFTQGMSHEKAMEKNLGLEQLNDQEARDRFEETQKSLPNRPDYDGYLTKKEADNWWLGKSGQPLFVDQSKIELPGISTKSFDNKEGSFIYKNFVWGLSNTGKVYGTLKLTLINVKTGTVHLGGVKYMDEYDFASDGRWARDFATWWGRPGEENDGKSFLIYGYGQATVPVKK